MSEGAMSHSVIRGRDFEEVRRYLTPNLGDCEESVVTVRWDPRQYAAYADERARPFFELLARVDVAEPAAVVDLGCGPGGLTATLLDRWPNATVVGVDSSAEMIESAAEHAVAGRLSFVHADVASWQPQEAVDVVLANAVLQWVPDHLELLPRIVSWLRP